MPGSNTEVPGSKLRPQADSVRLTPISSTIIIAAKLRFIAGSLCMKLVSCYATEAPQWIVIHRDAPWSRADGGSAAHEASSSASPSNRTRAGLIQGRADVAWSHQCNGRSKEAPAERSVRTVGFQEEHHDVVGVDPGCGEVLHKAFDERSFSLGLRT